MQLIVLLVTQSADSCQTPKGFILTLLQLISISRHKSQSINGQITSLLSQIPPPLSRLPLVTEADCDQRSFLQDEHRKNCNHVNCEDSRGHLTPLTKTSPTRVSSNLKNILKFPHYSKMVKLQTPTEIQWYLNNCSSWLQLHWQIDPLVTVLLMS